MKINEYEKELSQYEIELGEHRNFVGGMWNEIGELQFNFMVSNGLTSNMKLLDLGCGSFRGGIHFISFLEKGNYFAIDANRSLIQAGLDIEIPKAKLNDKVVRNNICCNPNFDVSVFNEKFDRVIALSVFTHLPLNHIRLCLISIVEHLKVGAKLYASVFLSDNDDWINEIVQSEDGVISSPVNDPYHYRYLDMVWAADGLPLNVEHVSNWGHPRNQKMICFTKK